MAWGHIKNMFFEAERQCFFRPLNGKRRELVAACIRTLYDRLHGPGADYSQALNRDALRDILIPAIQEHSSLLIPGEAGADDELGDIDSGDANLLAGALIRSFLKDGWLETFGDHVGLVTAYRFTRPGKLFAEALWSLSRLRTRSRQRNVRGCRNALEAARKNVDAYDLIDAYDYAEKVISDLSERVDYFLEMSRGLMSQATRTPWDEFMEFLDKFEKDFKKQMTADNVERHRQSIRDAINKLRSIDQDQFNSLEQQLADLASWANPDGEAISKLDWILERIEDMVEAACDTKFPELRRAMSAYVRHSASLSQQGMMLRSGQARYGFARAISEISERSPEEQTTLLSKLGDALAATGVRLLDPASFKIKTTSQRRKATAITVTPRVTRDSKLAAAITRAEAGAFALSNDEVVLAIRRELRLRNRPMRLSTLPLNSATEVLKAMQAVEAIRSLRVPDMRATKLKDRLMSPFYSSDDYQIETCDEPDNSSR